MFLPKPKHKIESKWNISDDDSDSEPANPITNPTIPNYPNRLGWLPEKESDFCGGGAYPELLLFQYPLDLGRKDAANAGHQAALSLSTSVDGKVQYDLVLHRDGKVRNGKIVHSSIVGMKEQDMDGLLEMPSREEIEKVTLSTRDALEGLIDQHVKQNKPKELGAHMNGPQFVRYVPAKSDSSRIIRMSEVPVDPLEPPRFKHRKVPRPPGSPPPPVLRSPPRKVTAEEQKNWVIPPCISNWKNAKGYTIPLDKRLANDGRGLQDVTVSDGFAKLSEALFIADKHAREEVKLRNEMQSQLAQRQKKEKEEKLRDLAQRAREERSERPILNQNSDSDESVEDSDEDLTLEEARALRERQELRREKARERERQLRHAEKRQGYRNANSRPKDRDISEKIALGKQQPTASKESMYDQRLFNQTSGMSSGFTDSDAYNLYDKPLFNATAVNIYKPTKGAKDDNVAGVDTKEFDGMLAQRQVHKGFAGTDGVEGVRSGPVQFEKEADVFGVDAFMDAAKRGREDEKGDHQEKRTRR